MIDHRPPDSVPGSGDTGSSGRGTPPRPTQSVGPISDIYTQLFQATPGERAVPRGTPRREPRASSAPIVQVPLAPSTLGQSGLSLMQVSELILKQLYMQAGMLGAEIARQARLPFNVIDEGLVFLKDEKCIEVMSGDLLGRVSYRFNLTDLGRLRARDALESCRYVGPAPVSLESYVRQCALQTVSQVGCDPASLRDAFRDFIIRPSLLEELGPAVCSGKSIFIYGPPGNGKTVVAKGLGRFLNRMGGEIYVPYAIHCENSIVTIFDPTIHDATDNDEQLGDETVFATGVAPQERGRAFQPNPPDRRWRRIRRPVVITGGELTLDMLDLRYNSAANFYQAPLHIKANSGVFLIDDFGRQLVSPRDLLNRWILPLEERIDYMTLATGKKFAVPFEQLIIFSTNLDPRELVDEAFLRRIRHKINIGTPDRTLFTEIFRLACLQRQIAFHQPAVDYLYSTFYDLGKPPRASDARDLLEIVQSICRFRNQEVNLSESLLAEATQRFFCQL